MAEPKKVDMQVVRVNPNTPPLYANWASVNNLNDGFVVSYGYVDGLDIDRATSQGAMPEIRISTQVAMTPIGYTLHINDVLRFLARLPKEIREKLSAEDAAKLTDAIREAQST